MYFIQRLVKAEELKINSIAFPALGGGIFGFPREIAAAIMIQTCIQYFEERANSEIRLVRFTGYDFSTVISNLSFQSN